jgi:hypothetical protein
MHHASCTQGSEAVILQRGGRHKHDVLVPAMICFLHISWNKKDQIKNWVDGLGCVLKQMMKQEEANRIDHHQISTSANLRADRKEEIT